MADLNELNEKVEQIKADIREQLEKIENTKGVYEYKKTILDKNGIIGGLMKQMGSVPKEEKADFGKKVNELKNWASEHFDELNTKLTEKYHPHPARRVRGFSRKSSGRYQRCSKEKRTSI